MSQDNILIAPFKIGIDTDISPWLASMDSFRELNNFHIRHGFLQKRSGFRVFGYMVHDPSATITGISQANPAVVTAVNTFSNGQKVLITGVTGMTEVNGNIYTVANATGADFELSGVDSTAFTAYSGPSGRADLVPEDRIMGIDRYFNADGTKNTLVFDTKRAAIYNGVTDRFDPLDTVDIMSGADTDFIWTENWQQSGGINRMYFTNGKAYDGASLDGIRYYDTVAPATTVNFNTNSLGGTRTLYGAKMIFAIKQRLVCLNVYEHDTASPPTANFPQRARWCQAQGPSNWDDTVAGGGGFVDAPTGEHIISARALQDVIIVFFTNSVWTLRPVPDPALPFRWDRINDFRACDGKMASTQYDRYVVALGVRGITATDGVETRRIDDRIQDFTTDEIESDEFDKVFCLRDYGNNRWWSLYTNREDASGNSENSKALILDEDSSAYSQYTIGMNCLGYGNFAEDYGYDDFIASNDLDIEYHEAGEATYQSYLFQESDEAFLGGDINGVVHIMQNGDTDNGADISCDLKTNAWNPYQAEGIEAQLNFVDIYVQVDQDTQIEVEFFKDTDVTPYATRTSDILPPLGFITHISNITQANPANVTAPEHGLSTGDVIYIYGVQGMTEVYNEYTITLVDSNNFTLDSTDSTSFTAYTGGGQVVRKKFYRTKSWKRILAGGIGFQHRMKISSTGANTPLKIEGFKTTFRPRGRRSIN